MVPPPTLFDLQPYTVRKSQAVRRPRRSAIRADVWAALKHLKATIDAVPQDELERRRRVYESTTRSARG